MCHLRYFAFAGLGGSQGLKSGYFAIVFSRIAIFRAMAVWATGFGFPLATMSS